jgi:hypothetical protein
VAQALIRYPLPVPEWTRILWASDEARELWEPRIRSIVEHRSAVERASVGSIRDACLQTVAPETIPQLSAMAAERGLTVLPLNRQAVGGDYQAGPPGEPEAGKPWAYRVALTTRAAATEWSQAWAASDSETLGRLLGYPACCREFFKQVWIDQGWIDTTWPMVDYVRDGETPPDLKFECPLECNILLRWIGVRWVPHLPCSLHCETTRELGLQFRLLTSPEIAAWMDELLDSPVEWSAWHGIAEIRTPVLTISTKTDATPRRLFVRRRGGVYPEAGVQGIGFPYAPGGSSVGGAGLVAAPTAPRSRELKRDPTTTHPEPPLTTPGGQEDPNEKAVDGSDWVGDGTRPRRSAVPVDPRQWTDNGFSSLEAMNDAHDVIEEVVKANLVDPGEKVPMFLDLGCGNGALLDRFKYYWQGLPACVGVEIDANKAERRSGAVPQIIVGDIAEVDRWRGEWSFVFLMPGRLVELRNRQENDDARVREALWAMHDEHGAQLVVYAYGDWLEKHAGRLRGLCKWAGLRGDLENLETGPGVEAGLWRW